MLMSATRYFAVVVQLHLDFAQQKLGRRKIFPNLKIPGVFVN